MKRRWPDLTVFCKSVFVLMGIFVVTACSVNPATGDRQFTALMSPSQELQVGAQEHGKIVKNFGVMPAGDQRQSYVERVGQSVATDTERPDITYKFTLLDSPVVNAFALPGGYVYVTRGLLAQANSEAELAAVLAHEIGHITARHSAERYSQNVLTSLGTLVLAVATESTDAARAASLGSELYIKSYSRSQEHQADELGLRYMHKAGYDTGAMAGFLTGLGRHHELEMTLAGRDGGGANYFSTHPQTSDRVAQVSNLAGQYSQNATVANRDAYFKMLDGIVFGHSAKDGFVHKERFYHRDMDFTFEIPDGFHVNNQSHQIVALSRDVKGAALIFDSKSNKQGLTPSDYLSQLWMKGEALEGLETLDVNGMAAATASFPGRVNNQNVDVRLLAVRWSADKIFRFQLAIPRGISATFIDDLKRSTYSLRHLTAQEKSSIKPHRIDIITAQAGDTVSSVGPRMPYNDFPVERFSVLNALSSGVALTAGEKYKIVAD